MSQWTHIAGIVRIDAIMQDHTTVKPHVKECFGNTVSFDDKSEVWDKCTVPYGSEGSLQYDIVYSGHQDLEGTIKTASFSWGTVQIWGDLRDYDNHEEIYKWLVKVSSKLKERHLYIRDIIVKVRVEYGKTYLITQNDDTEIIKIEIPMEGNHET